MFGPRGKFLPDRIELTIMAEPLPRSTNEFKAIETRLSATERELAVERARSSDLAEKLALAQQSLSAVTGLLNELSEHVPGMLYQTHSRRDGSSLQIPFVSERSQEYLGWSPAELRDQPLRLLESIHPDDRAEYYKTALAAGQQLAPFAMEFRVVSRTGNVRWLAVSSRPRDLGGGEVIYSGLALDITARKQMEETLRVSNDQLEQHVAERTDALRQLAQRLQQEVDERTQNAAQLQASQAQLSAIMENAPDAILEVDPNCKIVFINRVAPGYSKSQVIGTHVLDWSPHSTEIVREKFAQLFATGEPQSYENEVITADGSLRWYEVRMGPIRVDGKIVGATVIATEATERRLTEQALHRERSTLQSILAHMPLGVFVCEMPSALPVVWNQRLFEITGREKPSEFLHYSQLSAYYQAFKCGTGALYPVDELPIVRAMRGEASRSDDMEVERPDGSRVALEIVGSPILNAQGEVALAMIMVQDITERKQAESAVHTEQQFLRDLIGSHEKDRQLMAYEIHDGLVQYIASALMFLESIEPAQLPTTFARQSIEQAASLLRKSIADARRMLSGLRPPILDEQGIVEAIRYLIAETEAAGEIDIEFSADVPSRRFESLLEGTLFRIVQESLSNIRKHSQSKRASIELRQTAEGIELVVRDRGLGFDPTKVPAHRLGLQGISRRAALMGGQATIESTPGVGTAVTVRLPGLPVE